MSLMTEERRKEMEEEMSRFELEILAPDEGKGKGSSHPSVAAKGKPLSPPPPPPSAVAARMPEVAVLAKAPPPPPPHSPPVQAILRPPPPPPMMAPQQSPSVRFIPHQLHRQPNRLQMRPNFMGMRGPMPGPPQQFHPQNSYGPPMGMGGPPMQHHPMHPGPHHMHGMGPGPMPHHMNMGVSLPMPPGFCPPGPPMGHNMGYDQQYAHDVNNEEPEVPSNEEESSAENPTVVASAPTIYAAPFVKNPADQSTEAVSGNGQDTTSSSVTSVAQKSEKFTFGKTVKESTVGPVMPTGNEEAVVSKKREKKKKIVRMAGGQAWEDNSLLEWETDDFRIFCGDLGNDVTDEVLIRAFSKYTSFIKAKVVRDKRTNKTKGFGFVSFKDPQDFIKAMREMNGRYVGSRPIKLRKSTWRDRNIDIVKKKQREKEKLGLL